MSGPGDQRGGVHADGVHHSHVRQAALVAKRQDLAAEVGRADVLVAAIGRAELIKGAWVKPGATVIDVGMNRLPDGKLKGDVEFAPPRKGHARSLRSREAWGP